MQHSRTAAVERRRIGFKRQLLTASGTAAALLLAYFLFVSLVGSHTAPAPGSVAVAEAHSCVCQQKVCIPRAMHTPCQGSEQYASSFVTRVRVETCSASLP